MVTNYMVIDTETANLFSPFVYDIGFIVGEYNDQTQEFKTIAKRQYLTKEVFDNRELFATAHFSGKRDNYLQQLENSKGNKEDLQKKSIQEVFEIIAKILKKGNIKTVYAFNSEFDQKVFSFNADFYGLDDPFKDITFLDIRGNVHKTIAFTKEYKQFCEDLALFTESGNYKTTAETVYNYIRSSNVKTYFLEDHTALSDSVIENEILIYTIKQGLELDKKYETSRSVQRTVARPFQVMLNGKEILALNVNGISQRGNKVYLRQL